MIGIRELLTCAGCLGAAVIGAHFGSLYYGWPGGVGGFLLGPLAYLAVVLVLLGIDDLLRREWPPSCADGVCRGGFWHKPGNYELVTIHDIPDREFHIIHRCKCGHDYERVGRRFRARLPDGTLHPYMIYRPYRGWFPDPEAETPSQEAD
jgi:hypothetical protein